MNSQTDPVFNINSIVLKSRTVGPHSRLAIFFQGCNLSCEGCSNDELMPFEKKHLIHLSKLSDIFEKAKQDYAIEGITLLGGEPTLQKEWWKICSKAQTLGLGVILYTGKSIEAINKTQLKHVDLVIDGPFMLSKPDKKRRGIGSTNQKIIHLSARYRNSEKWFVANKREGEFSLRNDDIVYTGDEIINPKKNL